MRRGRPTVRIETQREIIKLLSSVNIPMNVSNITKNVSRRFGKNLSWNTVQKYINELVKLEKVQAINLPHSKIEGKTGLTLYILKK